MTRETTTRGTNYDKQPTIAISQDASLCVSGWLAIVAAARNARGSAECTVVVAECYPGVDTDEVRSGLTFEAETILFAETALKSAGELEEILSPFLGDDPVFGRMAEWKLESLFDEGRTAALRKEIATAPGLVLMYGTGAAYVAQQWDLLLYCDVTRWEIQQRQRAHRVGNLGANNERATAAELYKRAYFVDWRVADVGGLKISDLIVNGVSLRTAYRSDVASVIQINGGNVAGLLGALRQKTGGQ